MKETDVIVIGAGIAGLSASIYLKRASVSFILLEKGAPGGKLLNVHRIDNYPGYQSISGPELAAKLFEQASSLGVSLEYGDVISVTKKDDLFEIKTDVEAYLAKAVIVATGTKPQVTGFAGEKEFLGRGISYCATCDGNFFKNKKVAVIGYTERAALEAIYLSSLASHLYFIAPKELTISESLLSTLQKDNKVEFILNASPVKVTGNAVVESLTIKKEGREKTIDVSGVFPLLGDLSSAEFLGSLNVTNEKGYVNVDERRMSKLPGLFAAGDAINKALRQAVTAAGDGAEAATMAIQYVHSLKKK